MPCKPAFSAEKRGLSLPRGGLADPERAGDKIYFFAPGKTILTIRFCVVSFLRWTACRLFFWAFSALPLPCSATMYL